jgi:enamine deaminase RidA (YjgF/YER057c/UK114 family)
MVAAWPGAKKQKEYQTQTLETPQELPAAVEADRARLVFLVSPLSARGLLSRQVRDALDALFRVPGHVTPLRLRAFVAGSGDLRRVRDLVSETFTRRHLPLPVLTVAQVGALPLEGAQVVIESTGVAGKPTNPHGLAFIAGQSASSDLPLDPVLPLAKRAAEDLRKAVLAAGCEPADVMRLTCFLSSFDELPRVRALFDATYPAAARDYVQFQRAPFRAAAACEAVARLRKPPAAPLTVLNPEGLERSGNSSQIALVAASRVVLSGGQSAFGVEDADARLAFQRLEEAVEGAGSSLKRAAFAGFYPLTAGGAAEVHRIRASFFDPERPPASTTLLFEGLPSMDARFAVDVVAVKE